MKDTGYIYRQGYAHARLSCETSGDYYNNKLGFLWPEYRAGWQEGCDSYDREHEKEMAQREQAELREKAEAYDRLVEELGEIVIKARAL